MRNGPYLNYKNQAYPILTSSHFQKLDELDVKIDVNFFLLKIRKLEILACTCNYFTLPHIKN